MATSINEDAPSSTPPYSQLYIYHLSGSLPLNRDQFSESFIGTWEEEDTSFLFFSKPAEEIVTQWVSQHPGVSLLDGYQMSYEQWQGGAVTSYTAGRFHVQPPWEDTEDASRPTRRAHPSISGGGNLPILLDPGVVFGTGTHPTTRDCLTALETAFAQKEATTVLDLGTGTGLLAIAAARLGARRTIAVDLNLLAVQTAAENIRRNSLEHRIMAVQGRAEEMVSLSADLLIANIHYDVMQHIVASDGFLQKRGYILSGILRSQTRELEFRLAERRRRVISKWDHENTWFTFYGQTA
ncbi:Ribosomal protein L11 methyltransferase [Olavius algarvensis associated proteobacterium Delta 3]|nr:Ribosomal protein L11 methyltransferase [Olavius algarvensis associated proteobacterium Delta 3]